MPTLGIEHKRLVKGPGETNESAGEVYYRDATSDEWTKFQGELAQVVVGGEIQGERMSALCYRWGSEVLLRADGFSVPDGMEQIEALRKFAPEIVAEIGKLVFMQGGGRKLDLGKSASPQPPSTAEPSATSSEAPANT